MTLALVDDVNTPSLAPSRPLPPMDREAAELLAAQIRQRAESVGKGVVELTEMIQQARNGKAHEALGYESWTGFLADVLAGLVTVNRETRRPVIELLRREGMTQRAIAKALKVSQSTVRDDLSSSYSPRPDKVTGLDGKSYPAGRPPKADQADNDDFGRDENQMISGLRSAVTGVYQAVNGLGGAIAEVANNTRYLVADVGLIDPLLSDIAELRQRFDVIELSLWDYRSRSKGVVGTTTPTSTKTVEKGETPDVA